MRSGRERSRRQKGVPGSVPNQPPPGHLQAPDYRPESVQAVSAGTSADDRLARSASAHTVAVARPPRTALAVAAPGSAAAGWLRTQPCPHPAAEDSLGDRRVLDPRYYPYRRRFDRSRCRYRKLASDAAPRSPRHDVRNGPIESWLLNPNLAGRNVRGLNYMPTFSMRKNPEAKTGVSASLRNQPIIRINSGSARSSIYLRLIMCLLSRIRNRGLRAAPTWTGALWQACPRAGWTPPIAPRSFAVRGDPRQAHDQPPPLTLPPIPPGQRAQPPGDCSPPTMARRGGADGWGRRAWQPPLP